MIFAGSYTSHSRLDVDPAELSVDGDSLAGLACCHKIPDDEQAVWLTGQRRGKRHDHCWSLFKTFTTTNLSILFVLQQKNQWVMGFPAE